MGGMPPLGYDAVVGLGTLATKLSQKGLDFGRNQSVTVEERSGSDRPGSCPAGKPISMWPGGGWKPRQAKIAPLPLKRQPCGCVYRKLKLGHNGDAVRQDRVGMDTSSSLNGARERRVLMCVRDTL
jgi:hypothetical protein